MNVRRGRRVAFEGRRAHDTTTRNVLLGTAAVGVVGALAYLLSRPAASKRPLTLGAPLPQAATCLPPLPTSGSALPSDGQLIAFGTCQGVNLVQALPYGSTSLWSDITSAIGTVSSSIAEGAVIGTAGGIAVAAGLEGAWYVASIVGADTIASALTIAGAAVIPIAGEAIAVVGAVVILLERLGIGGCTIDVPKTGGGTENIDCVDYPQFVSNAINWVAESPYNTSQAMTMTVAQFCNQTNIFPTASLLTGTPLGRLAGLSTDNLPGAYEILKQLQLPAAAAIASQTPGLLIQLTTPIATNDGSAPAQAPLQAQFPALTVADMQMLQEVFLAQYTTAVQEAVVWISDKSNWSGQIKSGAFQSDFQLSSTDAFSLLNQYAPGNYTVTSPLASNTDLNPGSVIPGGWHEGSGIVIGGGAPGAGLTVAKTTAAGVVAKSTAVVAGAAGLALLGYKLYTGYSYLKTAQGAWADLKKGASKVKSEFSRRRKSNPLVLPGRSSATGGRVVAYRVRLVSLHETIRFNGQQAELIRYGKRIAAFKPSAFQKTKIRAGRGEVLIFQDQLGGG